MVMAKVDDRFPPGHQTHRSYPGEVETAGHNMPEFERYGEAPVCSGRALATRIQWFKGNRSRRGLLKPLPKATSPVTFRAACVDPEQDRALTNAIMI